MVNQIVSIGLVAVAAISIIFCVIMALVKNKKKTPTVYSGKRSAFTPFYADKPIHYNPQSSTSLV
jgi:hypothetical protein